MLVKQTKSLKKESSVINEKALKDAITEHKLERILTDK